MELSKLIKEVLKESIFLNLYNNQEILIRILWSVEVSKVISSHYMYIILQTHPSLDSNA